MNIKKSYFILSSFWNFYETPNSIFILKSLLEKKEVSPSRIMIFSLKDLINKEKIKKIKKSDKDPVFFISVSQREKWKIKNIKKILIKLRKSFKESKIILGGPTITTAPGLFLKDKIADFISLGEAEVSLPAILDYISKKRGIIVPNTYILQNKKYIFAKAGETASLPEIYDSQKEVVNIFKKKSLLKEKEEKYINLEFSRGCKFSCSFCYEPLARRNLKISPDRWLRALSPEKSCALLESAIESGCKKIFITSNSLTSLPDFWMKNFLNCLNKVFKEKKLPLQNSVLRFASCPVDFQRKTVKKFIRELSRYFYLFIDIGVETLDKKTLEKFNKPHKKNLGKVINKITKLLLPLLKKNRLNFYPDLICIHPWITFGEIKKNACFWHKCGLRMESYAGFFTQHELWINNEDLDIAKKIKKERLFLKEKDGFGYNFAYGKKVRYPKNKKDSDIRRFIGFTEELKNKIKEKFKLIRKEVEFQANFEEILQECLKKKSLKEKDCLNKKICLYWLNVLKKAEQEWPKLTYREYKKESQIEIKKFIDILKNDLNIF